MLWTGHFLEGSWVHPPEDTACTRTDLAVGMSSVVVSVGEHTVETRGWIGNVPAGTWVWISADARVGIGPIGSPLTDTGLKNHGSST